MSLLKAKEAAGRTFGNLSLSIMLKLSESCEILQEGDALYNSEQCGDAGRPSACTLACSMVVYKVVQVTQSSQYL